MDSYCFKEFIYGFSKVRAKLSSLCIVILFFGTNKIFIGKIHYGHLFVPGQA